MSQTPVEVRELIRTRVVSMDHVEVLMRLHERPDEKLDEPELRKRTRLEPTALGKALEDLVTDGLVSRDPASGAYSFSPKDAADRAAVEALAELYHKRPVTLVKLIYDRPPNPVTTFADAFRIRDEPKKP